MFKDVRHVFLTTVIAVSCFGMTSFAQQRTVEDGVFTEAQAEAGKMIYDENCRTCHDMEYYESIWDYWVEKPLLNFWFVLVGEMPIENPGSLYDSEYTEIVAYILSEMGFPAGDAALDPNNGMDQISIAAP